MTKQFPFSAEDWIRVSEAARALLNATLADDNVLRSSHFQELYQVLTELRAKYGDHPVLVETEADFTDAPAKRRSLYESALEQCRQSHLPTYSIRLSLARLLLDEFLEPHQALAELKACQPELSAHADEFECEEWTELLARCRTEYQTSGDWCVPPADESGPR